MAGHIISETPAGGSAARTGYRRFLGTGFGSGAIASVCCVGTAIAVGAGLSGLSFFRTWMNQYQIYFILLGVAVMAVWLVRQARQQGGAAGLKAGLRAIARQALIMGVVFAVTLGVTASVAGIVSM